MTDQKRPYRMKRRAELEQATRRRITESAVELHGSLGPARTSMSAVAEHAGVRRSTLYRHFPDEMALFEACTSHWRAANPVPDLASWAAIEDPDERLHVALAELYAFYRSTQRMLENLHRDQAVSAPVAHHFGRFHAYLENARTALMEGRPILVGLPSAGFNRLQCCQAPLSSYSISIPCRSIAAQGETPRGRSRRLLFVPRWAKTDRGTVADSELAGTH